MIVSRTGGASGAFFLKKLNCTATAGWQLCVLELSDAPGSWDRRLTSDTGLHGRHLRAMRQLGTCKVVPAKEARAEADICPGFYDLNHNAVKSCNKT